MAFSELTPEQQRVFSFIVKHRDETGFPPTVREIAGQGIAAPTMSVNTFVDRTERLSHSCRESRNRDNGRLLWSCR